MMTQRYNIYGNVTSIIKIYTHYARMSQKTNKKKKKEEEKKNKKIREKKIVLLP